MQTSYTASESAAALSRHCRYSSSRVKHNGSSSSKALFIMLRRKKMSSIGPKDLHTELNSQSEMQQTQ